MKHIAILHEDTGHKNLITAFIEYLNDKEKSDLDINLIDFFDMENKSNFFKPDFKAYKALKQRVDANEVTKILFIIDADYVKNNTKYNGVINTKKELDNIISQFNFQNISKEVFILHDPEKEEGYLESLLLATLPEAKRGCITGFINCSEINSKNFYKTIIYGLHKIAYPIDSYYTFTDSHFDDLKLKLTNLFK